MTKHAIKINRVIVNMPICIVFKTQPIFVNTKQCLNLGLRNNCSEDVIQEGVEVFVVGPRPGTNA